MTDKNQDTTPNSVLVVPREIKEELEGFVAVLKSLHMKFDVFCHGKWKN